MRLIPPRTLSELADYAENEIRQRLDDLGSAGLPHTIVIQGSAATPVTSLCPVEAIQPGCLTFAQNEKYLEQVEASAAAAVIVPPHLSPTLPCLKAPHPRLTFTVLLEMAGPPRTLIPALPENVRFKHRPSVNIGSGSIIGDFCYIGARVKIGHGCRIYPHVFIDDDVTIGDGCVVYPQAVLFRRTVIGRKVIIHGGAVIGDDGFGYDQVQDPDRGRLLHMKDEHMGGVVVGDYVEIGSQVCIDRGLVENTVIGPGTKIDNQVQIAHNCKIGRDSIIVAQVGLAGHAEIGNRVFLLGQAGIGPGASVGDDAIITAKAGVGSKIPAGPALWSGAPARKSEEEYKQMALARRELPRVRSFFQAFKKAGSFEELKTLVFGRGKTEGGED